MMYSWLQKTLMVFLDLSGHTKEWHWHLIKEKVPSISEIFSQTKEDGKAILCFDRFEIVQYWTMLFKLSFCKRKFISRTVFLMIEDGLYKYIYIEDSKAYRISRIEQRSGKLFINSKQSFRIWLSDKLISCIPLALRAAQRYVVVTANSTVDFDLPSEIGSLNYMFFSSPDKKLLLASYETLCCGNGQLFKTTANAAYDAIIEKEQEIALRISQRCCHTDLLPEVRGRVEVNGRPYYQEKYIAGHSLTKRLRSPEIYKDSKAVRACIDRLDSWYGEYRRMFAGPKRSLEYLYAQIFEDFFQIFSADPEQCILAGKVQKLFAKLHGCHSGMIPVVSHNDLWPANILDTDKGLVVIDWERATFDRSEMFDYFWMIISTTLEFLSAPNGFDDFSYWFNCFLKSKDLVCIHARKKLKAHLLLNGISSDYMDLFIALFLMEFAIRGGSSLTCRSRIEKIAAEEFRFFVKQSISFDFNGEI